jgi:hypothetical protein
VHTALWYVQVSDIIVAAAFLAEAKTAEECNMSPVWARTFAVLSVFFILMPLILTALFISGVQRRSYVYRKQLHALQLSMQDVAPDGTTFVAHHKAKASFGADGMSGNFTQHVSNTSAFPPDYSRLVVPITPLSSRCVPARVICKKSMLPLAVCGTFVPLL